jgi:hypothetical protein
MPVVALLIACLVGAAPTQARPIVVVAANQSFNWSGYQQGAIEKGTTFHSVSADWIVPRVRQRVAGEAAYSSSWIGIGGGCLDTSCTATDVTLIQAGIGHDVDAAGNADYYAWWETIPGPLIRTDVPVQAGDRVNASIVENSATPGVWTITISDRDTGGAFTITLPYGSTYGTAEWVIETPVVIGDYGTITVGPMPDVAIVRFDNAMANGAQVVLVPAERIELVDFDLSRIAAPSLPDRDADGFNDCAHRKTCPAPGRELH